VVTVKALSRDEWARVGENLASQVLFVAKLLAGEMPQDIEQAFADVGLSLFPERAEDLETHCSCPDWSNPCKHIAAVHYLLGEEFDRDPFLIFKLRGMEREGLIELLGLSQADAAAEPAPETAAADLPEQPLPADPPEFWHPGPLPDDLFGEVRVPPVPAALPKRLGNFPFWRGEEALASVLEPIYTAASSVGMGAFLEEQEQPERPSL
jgi:uncharacterized Zn finger protein